MPDQCRAVTEGGERCSRPAKENGFCHQHGPENETVDEADAAETTDAEEDDEREDSNVPEDTDSEEETESEDSTETEHDDAENGDESESASEAESQDSESNGETDSAESASDANSESDEPSTIVTVRNRVRDQVPQLIGRQLDGVTSLRRGEDGWVATVELIERRSVPDTQDILGQYEVSLTDDGVIHEYRRLETYRRADGAEYQT